MARGDHLVVHRGVYTHHGIDLGDGRVVHYDGPKKAKAFARVRISSLADFAAGKPVLVRPYSWSHPPEIVVARARAALESGTMPCFGTTASTSPLGARQASQRAGR